MCAPDAGTSPDLLADAKRLLEQNDKHPAIVYRRWTVQESGEGCEVILYTDLHARPRTARLMRMPGAGGQLVLTDYAGWDQLE